MSSPRRQTSTFWMQGRSFSFPSSPHLYAAIKRIELWLPMSMDARSSFCPGIFRFLALFEEPFADFFRDVRRVYQKFTRIRDGFLDDGFRIVLRPFQDELRSVRSRRLAFADFLAHLQREQKPEFKGTRLFFAFEELFHAGNAFVERKFFKGFDVLLRDHARKKKKNEETPGA